jgi:diguanylate cyclase (GGDEF)-like protein/PAS domain S-box-containing protein
MSDYNQKLTNEKATDNAIRASFIESLFDNPGSLIVGGLIQSATALLAYAETQSVSYIVLMMAMLTCSFWRYAIVLKFHREAPDLLDQKEALHWGNVQFVSLIIGAFLVGCFGLLGIYIAPGEFTQLASTIIVMATASTVLGKYYGSKRHTISTLGFLAAPYLAALLLRGDTHHIMMAGLAIPFIAMISGLAQTLRKTLFDSTRGRMMLAEIADKFNAALNNMPHGLVMIDEARRIEVANKQFYKILGIENSVKIEGRTLDIIFIMARRSGLFQTRDQADIASRKTSMMLARENGGTSKLMLSDGRTLQIVAKKRAKGGAVLVVEDVTARVEAETKIERMARFDELTHLQNRAFFKENVERVLSTEKTRRKGICALYAVDVDEFKSINDTYGHVAGDRLLQKLAENLNSLGKRNLFICRHGGDEFSVFAYHLADVAAAEGMAARIAAALNVHYDLLACRYSAAVSIGYATTGPDATDFQALMIRSDLALYARKADKRVPYRAYEEEMDRQQRERLQLKSDLGSAIRDGDLHLVYQPVIDMDKQRMTSCEALVRWNHPKLGMVPPNVFVPLAEEMGIVSEMTKFVIEEACRACASWPETLSVSVNLSAIDFERLHLADEIKATLKNAGLHPSRLEVEITETAAIKGQERVTSTLLALRAHGVHAALDDFGVGYSGLSHLHSLPLDRVKIDRSFILAVNNNERSLKLLASVIAMAKALDLKVTVEGIEDIETLERVMDCGAVEKVQGYIFGRHLTAEQIGELSSHAYASVRPPRLGQTGRDPETAEQRMHN